MLFKSHFNLLNYIITSYDSISSDLILISNEDSVEEFIPSDDLIVPYTATSLEDAEAIIHVIKISENDLKKQQVSGFYKDVDLGEPPLQQDEIEKKQLELQGVRISKQADVYTLLECHVNLDIEGFEDKDQNGEPTGIKLPYIVTIEEGSMEVLSIKRNYKACKLLPRFGYVN